MKRKFWEKSNNKGKIWFYLFLCFLFSGNFSYEKCNFKMAVFWFACNQHWLNTDNREFITMKMNLTLLLYGIISTHVFLSFPKEYLIILVSLFFLYYNYYCIFFKFNRRQSVYKSFLKFKLGSHILFQFFKLVIQLATYEIFFISI